MDNGPTRKPLARTVRCEDCGAERNNIPWVPGTPCPECSSLRFEPVVVIGGASDYDAADRSSGFALEDIRFGRLATWAQLITPKQLQRALFQQSQRAQRTGSAPDLATIFLKEKTLDKRQIDAILSARCVEPGNTDDIEFGLMAVRLGLVTEAQVSACRKAQRDAMQSGRDAPPLPLLMCEKRILKEGQVLALLQKAELRGKGVLRTIKRAAAKEHRRQRAGAGIIGQLAAQPAARAGAVGLLILLAALFLYRGLIAPEGTYVTVRCANCGAEGGAPLKSEWPIQCPACKAKTMYPLAICLDCGERFIVKNPMGYGVACPKCGASNYKLLTSDLDMAKVEAEIKNHAENSGGPGE